MPPERAAGGGIVDVHPGQTISFAPGGEHFHAARQDSFMEHIAVLEAADDPTRTDSWLELNTDDNGTN
ncbi:hypothetical protein BIU97_02855 [Curtobacterium sp. MCBA15_009]|uniref:hypothetical protein n=1 Tax=Curtobacterium sp. MCBA15_009 TaxID=1898737 RepID=UPI0008DD597B|nr:hypothetical protein [Curtobacterium sp. MCBA15_009]OII12891.1 hypothetical protein BIU97_02855 [Curtobacterium sp. MCBA15_009]